MKRFICAVFTVILLLGSAGANNGAAVVYITKTGTKYHSAGCGFLSRSCYEITLVNAVTQGYTPCSKCGPPRLNGEPAAPSPSQTDRSGGKLVDIKTEKPVTSESRTESMQREVNSLKENPIVKNAELRAANAENERDRALQQKEDAEREAAAAREELSSFKRSIFFASIMVGFVGVPLYCVWFACWRKQEIERITTAVRISMASSPKTDCVYKTPKQAMPAPKPEPKKSAPPIRNAYDLKGDNPYLREAYRQRYEGKSIAEEAGVPKNCGICFDAEGFPHQKSRERYDAFTVYITDKGKSYHTASCPSAKFGRAVNICSAKQRGLGPCGRCKPMEDLPQWIVEYQRIFRICKAFGIDIKP